MTKRGARWKTRSAGRWFAARSEPERAALISAVAALAVAFLGVTTTIVTDTVHAWRGSGTDKLSETQVNPMPSGDRGEISRPTDATTVAVRSPQRGREVVIDDLYSIDLDSPRSDLAVTDNDSTPGVDLTVRMGDPALDLALDARAFRAADDSDLSFCEAATATLTDIVSSNATPGRSFCLHTVKGSWLWLKIVRLEPDEDPGTITLIIDRLTPG